MTKALFDYIRSSEFAEEMAAAVKEAAQESERLGLPKAVMVDGKVHRLYPDGRLEPVVVPETTAAKPG